MTRLILDRFGRFRAQAAFFAPVGALERRPVRLIGFLISAAIAACGAALIVALAIIVLAALRLAEHKGLSLLDAIGAAVTNRPGRRPLLSYWFELSVAGLASYAAGLAVLGLAARFYRRPARSFLTAGLRFRWRLVGSGFLIGLVMVGLAVLAQRLLSPPTSPAPLLQPGASLGARLGYVGLAASCLYLAALAEEIIFRGVLLQISAAFTRSLPLILALNGVIFSLAHFDPDPSGFVIRSVMGAGWAWIALRTAGIEVTTGVHLANNLIISLFLTPISFERPAVHKLDLPSVLVELATVVLSALAAEALVRRNERRLEPVAPGPLATADEAG